MQSRKGEPREKGKGQEREEILRLAALPYGKEIFRFRHVCASTTKFPE